MMKPDPRNREPSFIGEKICEEDEKICHENKEMHDKDASAMTNRGKSVKRQGRVCPFPEQECSTQFSSAHASHGNFPFGAE